MLAVADMEGLLETLKECNAQLEIVEKGLNQFLETKKMAFPRCSLSLCVGCHKSSTHLQAASTQSASCYF